VDQHTLRDLLQHGAPSNVVETTYLGMLFILSAKPMSSFMDGHAAAKPW
jgi:hypothetical protein